MTQSPNSTGLKKHDNVKHKGLVPAFKCEFCPHVAKERGNLRQHIRSKHEHVNVIFLFHLHKILGNTSNQYMREFDIVVINLTLKLQTKSK